mmetsp:Transcript_27156/g.49437  ORF Transcript_27156/g.49437 Transcript_27156/m.49437 type:complete len:246 (-) Transcript_27156:137-874(-)
MGLAADQAPSFGSRGGKPIGGMMRGNGPARPAALRASFMQDCERLKRRILRFLDEPDSVTATPAAVSSTMASVAAPRHSPASQSAGPQSLRAVFAAPSQSLGSPFSFSGEVPSRASPTRHSRARASSASPASGHRPPSLHSPGAGIESIAGDGAMRALSLSYDSALNSAARRHGSPIERDRQSLSPSLATASEPSARDLVGILDNMLVRSSSPLRYGQGARGDEHALRGSGPKVRWSDPVLSSPT